MRKRISHSPCCAVCVGSYVCCMIFSGNGCQRRRDGGNISYEKRMKKRANILFQVNLICIWGVLLSHPVPHQKFLSTQFQIVERVHNITRLPRHVGVFIRFRSTQLSDILCIVQFFSIPKSVVFSVGKANHGKHEQRDLLRLALPSGSRVIAHWSSSGAFGAEGAPLVPRGGSAHPKTHHSWGTENAPLPRLPCREGAALA